jgi:hypothetical protein
VFSCVRLSERGDVTMGGECGTVRRGAMRDREGGRDNFFSIISSPDSNVTLTHILQLNTQNVTDQ